MYNSHSLWLCCEWGIGHLCVKHGAPVGQLLEAGGVEGRQHSPGRAPVLAPVHGHLPVERLRRVALPRNRGCLQPGKQHSPLRCTGAAAGFSCTSKSAATLVTVHVYRLPAARAHFPLQEPKEGESSIDKASVCKEGNATLEHAKVAVLLPFQGQRL